MAWTKQQVMLANQAAREAGLVSSDGKDTSGRDLLLQQFEGRALLDGRLSTRALRLTQLDFERFMGHVEFHHGHGLGNKPFGYWQEASREGNWKRLRYLAQELADKLKASTSEAYVKGAVTKALAPTGGWSGDLDNCDEAELSTVINALKPTNQRRSA